MLWLLRVVFDYNMMAEAAGQELAKSASPGKLRLKFLCLLERFSDIDERLLPTAAYVLMNDDL